MITEHKQQHVEYIREGSTDKTSLLLKDVLVNPKTFEFASRFPRKCTEYFLAKAPTETRVFISFNFSGIPGSSQEFATKTLSQEIQDAEAVISYIKETYNGLTHLVIIGLSTGAIISQCLRGRIKDNDIALSFVAIAAVCNIPVGLKLDFSTQQLEDFNKLGYCWKEFYLPDSDVTPSDYFKPGYFRIDDKQLLLRLNYCYMVDFKTLNLPGEIQKLNQSPILYIHGAQDIHVPIALGKEAYEKAAEPKAWVEISKSANHLLTSSNALKKALNAIESHITHRSNK